MVVPRGETSVHFQLQSSLIGIHMVDCDMVHRGLTTTQQIEVIVGRRKVLINHSYHHHHHHHLHHVQVEQNILANIMFSVGIGFALLIMGMEIDLDQVFKVVK